jgi:hypothetical protein
VLVFSVLYAGSGLAWVDSSIRIKSVKLG